MADATGKLPAPIVELQMQLLNRRQAFVELLPKGVTPETFIRTVLVAVLHKPALLRADRRSLVNACLQAAQDALRPDGKEGALVEYYDEKAGKIVTWQPMVFGLRKLVRQSGLISGWEVQTIHKNDRFRYVLGDEPKIEHEPLFGDRGPLIGAYSIAKFRDGYISREVIDVDWIIRIRDRSNAWRAFKAGKIRSTPWQSDFEEMARKTVAKLHAKQLPTSREIDTALGRDETLFIAQGEKAPPQPPLTLGAPGLEDLAGEAIDDEGNGAAAPRRTRKKAADRQRGEDDGGQEGPDAQEVEQQDDDTFPGDRPFEDNGPQPDPQQDYAQGQSDHQAGLSRPLVDGLVNDPDRFRRWQAGWNASFRERGPVTAKES